MRGRLTAATVRALTARGRYADGGTLYLNVAPGGSKSWVQRLVVNGRRHDIGLGGWPVVTLEQARAAAIGNRQLAYRGINPLEMTREARRRSDVPTFREAAHATIQSRQGRWRSAKTARNWRKSLELYAFPRLGDRPVNRIDRSDVLRILTPIWTDKPELARKLRQHLRAVFTWSQAHGHVTENAAGEAIRAMLPPQPKVRTPFRALPYAEVGAALDVIARSGASDSAKLCLRLVILTAVRSGDARFARWSEIDAGASEWRIPAERTKASRVHRVPLSDAALEALRNARALDDSSGLCFPSPVKRGRPLSDMTLSKLLRGTGLAASATVHGFRMSFREWCAVSGQPREIVEAALAHAAGGVEGEFFRSVLFEQRRNLMEGWARHLTAPQTQ